MKLAVARFFVSYARTDQGLVRQLLKLLSVSGASIFIDQDDIAPGEDWRATLANAISEADAVLLFWSKNASVSKWVKREWQLGQELKKRVVPVRLDGTAMPRQLSWLQAIDLRVPVALNGFVHKPAYLSLLEEWQSPDQEQVREQAVSRFLDQIGRF